MVRHKNNFISTRSGGRSPRLTRPRTTALLVTAATLLLLCACAEEKSIDPDNSIIVGLLLPFTGGDAALGAAYERAAILAKDVVNDAGGIDGKPLVFVTRDTHSDPDRAKASLEEILAYPVAAVIGPESSEIAGTAVTRTAQEETTLLSPVISGAADIEIPESVDWFRLAPSSALLGRAFANYLIDNDLTVIAAVYSNEEYHVDFAESFVAQFTALGGTVEESIVLAPGRTGYGDDVLKLKALGTRNILFSASTRDAARFVNDLITTDTTDRFHWYLSPPLETPVLLENAYKGALEGAEGIGIQVYDADEEFIEKYQSRWNDTPTDGTFFYYDAVALLALSLQRTALTEDGKIPNDTLQEMIRATVKPQGIQINWDTLGDGMEQLEDGNTINYLGLTGRVVFKDGQQVIAPMKIWRIEDNEFVPIDEI